MDLEVAVGTLPPNLLPSLQHLTHLGLTFSAQVWDAPPQVSWSGGVRVEGSSRPRLRSLRLCNARLPPQEATIASLGQLEELRLQGFCAIPSTLPALLHSLSGLTSLELDYIYTADDPGEAQEPEQQLETGAERSLELVTGCRRLRRLVLPLGVFLEMDLPPGALQQLSYLSVEDVGTAEPQMSVSWASLPSLEHLRLAGWVWTG